MSSQAALSYDASSYLDRSFERRGIGSWRAIYLRLISALTPSSVIEIGAGSPDFLDQVAAASRIAVDVGQRFADKFQAHGIAFACRDIERDDLSDLGPAEVVVCSDVFEHLMSPATALDRVADTLAADGILLSHVPNEFRPRHMFRIMMGRGESVKFHAGHAEWEDPHFRRFTDIGYRAFLARRFRHSLVLTDLRNGRLARMMTRVGLAVPYCLQEGPTYASTNSPSVYQRLVEVKRTLA